MEFLVAQLLNGLVHASVAVAQLVGAKAEGAPEDLVAEADPEDRRARLCAAIATRPACTAHIEDHHAANSRACRSERR